jgi:acylphosphatase
MATASQSAIVRRSIRALGIVQGVGFRPYVYNLARKYGLSGYVLNSSSGVTIEIEGPAEAVEAFVEELQQHPPALARVEAITVSELAPHGDATFSIRESVAQAGEFVLVSPDVATCNECWRDCLDPENRRPSCAVYDRAFSAQAAIVSPGTSTTASRNSSTRSAGTWNVALSVSEGTGFIGMSDCGAECSGDWRGSLPCSASAGVKIDSGSLGTTAILELDGSFSFQEPVYW